MKKVKLLSMCALIITLLIMIINRFFLILPDWIIRIDGIIMLFSVFTASYSTIKCHKKN